jgi:hypothetical protein
MQKIKLNPLHILENSLYCTYIILRSDRFADHKEVKSGEILESLMSCYVLRVLRYFVVLLPILRKLFCLDMYMKTDIASS